MNEDSTPLQALNKIANIEMKEQYKVDKGGFVYRVVSDEYSKELKVIEKALKEKETPTETFEQFVGEPSEVIYKKLKALEIIKKWLPQLEYVVETDNYNEYLDTDDNHPNDNMSEQEYNLLKEVLK